jgi:hypothetical protein
MFEDETTPAMPIDVQVPWPGLNQAPSVALAEAAQRDDEFAQILALVPQFLADAEVRAPSPPDVLRLLEMLDEDGSYDCKRAREELAAVGVAVLEPAITAWPTFGLAAREVVAELLQKAGVRDARVLLLLTAALDAGLEVSGVSMDLASAMWALDSYGDAAAAPHLRLALDRFLDEANLETAEEARLALGIGALEMADETVAALARMGEVPTRDQAQRFDQLKER